MGDGRGLEVEVRNLQVRLRPRRSHVLLAAQRLAQAGDADTLRRSAPSGASRDFLRGLIFKNHVYSAEQTDLVLPCSKTYRLDEKFVDTAENQPLKVSRSFWLRQHASSQRDGKAIPERPPRSRTPP